MYFTTETRILLIRPVQITGKIFVNDEFNNLDDGDSGLLQCVTSFFG